MNDVQTARDVLAKSLKYFADYLDEVNQFVPATNQYNYPTIFPALESQELKTLANKIQTKTIGQDIWKYLKKDFGNVGPQGPHRI